MKKKYSTPKLIAIGDMVHNTLGASGNVSDNGTMQAGGNGSQSNSTQNDGAKTTTLNSNNFDNNSFNNNGF